MEEAKWIIWSCKKSSWKANGALFPTYNTLTKPSIISIGKTVLWVQLYKSKIEFLTAISSARCVCHILLWCNTGLSSLWLRALSVLFRCLSSDRKWTKFQTMAHFRRYAPAAEMWSSEGGGISDDCFLIGVWNGWGLPAMRVPKGCVCHQLFSVSCDDLFITLWNHCTCVRLCVKLHCYSLVPSIPLIPPSVFYFYLFLLLLVFVLGAFSINICYYIGFHFTLKSRDLLFLSLLLKAYLNFPVTSQDKLTCV